MRATGNGEIHRCVENLLAIIRGEVPYERLKGLNARVIDKPTDEATEEIKQDATWLLNTYEPRVKVNGITATHDDTAHDGVFSVTADVEEISR